MLVEQRVDGEVDGVGASEPRWLQVGGLQQERRPTVGHEGALAVRRDEDADPARPSAGHPDDARRHAIGADDIDQRAAGTITADSRDERRARPEPAEPAGGGRGRPALGEEDAAGDIGPVLERPLGSEHHVDDEIAQHDDPRPAR